MITITKNENLGNTFEGALAAAFNLKTTNGLKVNHLTATIGMVEVDGVDYDFIISGNVFKFFKAE